MKRFLVGYGNHTVLRMAIEMRKLVSYGMRMSRNPRRVKHDEDFFF